MKITLSVVLLILSVACFAIGALRPSLGGISWTNAGLGFAVASLVV